MATAGHDLWDVEVLPNGHGRVNLYPHAAQEQALTSEKRFIFLLAGTQGGKTSFGPHWLRREIQRKGPGDYIAVTSTFPLLQLKMLPEFLRLFRDTLHLGEWRAGTRTFEFSEQGNTNLWGEPSDVTTRVIFGSASHSESLESATAKGAWLDEVGQKEFRLDSWQAILRRLSIHQGRVLAGTTIYNLGWMKSEIYDAWRKGDDEIDVIQFPSVLNPMFPQAEFEAARRRLPEWKFRMFYLGEYDRPAGLIYSDFRDDYREDGGHKVHPFTIPPEWPHYGGIDFGAVHTARVLAAKDPEANVYYLYSESLEGDKTTAEHAADALQVTKGVNMREWRGGAKPETQQRMDWRKHGVPVKEPNVSDVEAGIDRVIALFKADRLYVFDTCKGLLDELGSYSRVTDENGNATEKIEDKETYHRLDAVRYLVQAFDAGLHTALPVALSQPSRWRG